MLHGLMKHEYTDALRAFIDSQLLKYAITPEDYSIQDSLWIGDSQP